MNEILLNGINLKQLLEEIEKLLDSKLANLSLEAPPTKLLSRTEVAKLLKITLPTLHEYSKTGWLQSYKIGKRVLYKSEEVKEALTIVLNNKNKKYLL